MMQIAYKRKRANQNGSLLVTIT